MFSFTASTRVMKPSDACRSVSVSINLYVHVYLYLCLYLYIYIYRLLASAGCHVPTSKDPALKHAKLSLPVAAVPPKRA